MQANGMPAAASYLSLSNESDINIMIWTTNVDKKGWKENVILPKYGLFDFLISHQKY